MGKNKKKSKPIDVIDATEDLPEQSPEPETVKTAETVEPASQEESK
jgi:hypothetical protein